MIDQVTFEAATVDARLAELEFNGARAWLDRPARRMPLPPLAAEVWVVDPGLGLCCWSGQAPRA
ncbi:hypothetical protein AB0C84_35715 [Actinomadura sp. NPDC048955]|uniref:hypothetical protein n=1 Tax=Actinomadura sp. NPDC048955 TaxID=3158228 RepID=UPI0033D824C9